MQLTKINGKYEIYLPKHRAERPEWGLENGGWEVKRIDEMISTINKIRGNNETEGPIVFDIGSEEGDISAILAQYTNCQIALFEANDRVWPCLKAIWDGNSLPDPIDFYSGFISSKTKRGILVDWNEIKGEMIHDHGFKQLYEKYPDVPQITLDEYCYNRDLYPDVITMDVEGSEWDIIKGAENVLRTKKPIIFMSVHPEFLFDSYRNEGIWKERYGERCFVVHMLRFISELGYTYRVIEWDYHECHFIFEPITK